MTREEVIKQGVEENRKKWQKAAEIMYVERIEKTKKEIEMLREIWLSHRKESEI